MMQISCQYCSQKYQINSNSIPDGMTSTRCKACGHTISLKPKAASSTKPDPAKTVQQTTGTKEITCLYCGKKYRIDSAKIPPGVTTTKCKACGRNLSLTPAVGLSFAFKDEISKKLQSQKPSEKPKVQQGPQVPIIQDIASFKSPVWRRPWALAATAILVVLCVGVLYGGSKLSGLAKETIRAGNIFKKERETTVEKRESVTVAHREPSREPFMALKVNVPLLMEAVDRNIPEEQKNIKYKMTTAILRSLGLSQVRLYLYPDPQNTFLPVIFVESHKGKSLEKQLKSHGNYIQFLEPVSDGVFRIKKDAIPRDKQNNFPIDRYRVKFIDNAAIFAPEKLAGMFTSAPDPVLNTQVGQLITSITQPGDLAVLSARIPENFSNEWQKTIRNNPALKQNPQIAMVAAMGDGVFAQLSEPLKDIESLAVGFRLDENNDRVLRYAQQFRKGVDASRIYHQLSSEKPDDLNANGMVLKLIEIFNDARYRHTIGHENNRLMLELNWEERNDKAILAALSEATVGQLFAQSMQLTPSEGPISAQYDAAPNLSTDIDIDKLKKTIPAIVQQSLFPGNYWDFGEEPRMTLELDTLDVPNASLAQMTYEVLDVASTDGASIMRVAENRFQHILNPGDVSPGLIDVNVQSGTPAEALGTAMIRFNMALPAALKKLEFSSGNNAGAVKESGGVRVKLDCLEKDVARITFHGGVSARLFAFDKTGRALASRESMSSASSAAARFQGEISTLMVVVVQKMLEYPFEIKVDLNRGKELALSHSPEEPARVRYDHQPILTYADYAEDDLGSLAVAWREAGGMTWTDSLSVTLPKGPFSGDIRWEVHFFGEREPVYLSGNSFYGSGEISYGLTNGELSKAHAAFGKIRMELASDIHRLNFVKPSDGKPIVQKLPSGEAIKVSFNQNEIAFDPGEAEIIQSMAFDAKGHRLKKDSYAGIKGGQKMNYFWGLPAKITVDVATQKIKKTIPFDLRQRPVDEAGYLKYKKAIENQREIVLTLKQIAKARRRDHTQYGDDIAGLLYLHDPKKQKPMELIAPEIAHSDPAGQKRFGYTLKPYKGYYFTVLSGVESGGGKNDYMRLPRQKAFSWQNGSFRTAPFLQPPDLVAIPLDQTQPTFFIQFDQVYMKPLNGTRLTYLPQDYYSKGWLEAKFVEG